MNIFSQYPGFSAVIGHIKLKPFIVAGVSLFISIAECKYNWVRRINSTPAYRLVAEAIERQILSGDIRPGEPIGTEAELVRQA